jgi:hypothetical protein
MAAAVLSRIGLGAECGDHQFGDLRACVLLLIGDQVPVADGEAP